jgi:hypothetical protein
MAAEGQLGLGDMRNVGGSPDSTPLKLSVVQMGGPAKFVSSGYKHTCAVLVDGAVRCWGEAAPAVSIHVYTH